MKLRFVFSLLFFCTFLFSHDSFSNSPRNPPPPTGTGRPSSRPGARPGGRPGGRLSADLYHSQKKQMYDLATLNLKKNIQNKISNATNSPISIGLADFDDFSAVGKTWLNYQNFTDSLIMNIGSANNSTAQNWALPADFMTYFEDVSRGDFVAISNVPAALRVAGANKVMRSSYYDENDSPMNIYDHYELDADGVFHIGSSFDLETGGDDNFDETDYEVADVPLDLNDAFTSTNEETYYINNQKLFKEVQSVNVDAFGTITTPTGTYNCLRMLSIVQEYTRPDETSSYTLVSTTNYISFLTKTGEYFTAKVSGTSGNVTISEIEYRTVVQTALLTETADVKLNNDSKGVTINVDNDTAHPSAILDVKSSNQGILIPRIAKANRPANPATGLLIFQIDDTPGFYYFDGTSWVRLATN